jgi:hypothetical protein
MIPVSSQIKTDCNSASITYKEYIIINGQTVEIKGKMSNTAYKDTTFFGTFNLKMLEFTTQNDVDYKGEEFEYYKEVNGNAFKIGTYITTNVRDSDSREQVEVTAMDYGLKFAIPYVSELDYSSGEVTLQDVWDEIATLCGVTTTQTITNGDFIVDGNQFSNDYMCGDVISHIAVLGGCFATINEDDELVQVFTSVETTESDTVTGTTVTLTNSNGQPLTEYSIDGLSTQATRSGKNLLDTLNATGNLL